MTADSDGPTNDRTAELIVMGKVVGNSTALEAVIAMMFQRVFQVAGEAATLIVGSAGTRPSLQMLKRYAPMQSEIPVDDLLAWVRSADLALEARNTVVHQPWVALPDSTTASHRANLRTGSVTPWTVSDVQKVSDDLRAAVEEGARLADIKITS